MLATKVLFLDSQDEQNIEFLLPNTNEYHSLKVASKQYSYKDGKLLNEENKLPIAVSYTPSTKTTELSCKRYFISRIIERLKLHLVRKYQFYFSIKSVKELHLIINKNIDVFDNNQYTYELSGILVLQYNKQDLHYTEKFNFSKISLLGDIVLDTTTTLPPVYWNYIKDIMHIPKNTIYVFYDNTFSFVVNNINYKFDIDTKELVNLAY